MEEGKGGRRVLVEEEEEIHTQEITINGTLYLIDNDNNLYSSDTHEQVGTYNTEANEVEAMLLALDHMVVHMITVSRGFTRFRKNTIAFE